MPWVFVELEPGAGLRVITWNVDWWQRGAPQTERVPVVLAQDDAVWLLQELRVSALKGIEQRWPGTSTFSVDVWPPASRRWMSCAVLLPAGCELHDAGCVEDLPRAQRGFWVSAMTPDLGEVTFVSWHCENAADGDEARVRKMQAYAAMRDWLVDRDGPVVLGVDTNSWHDPVDLPAVDSSDLFFEEHTFLGPDPAHGLVDAHRRRLAADGALDELRQERPGGPLAISYVLANDVGHRMDRILITPDLQVTETGYDMDTGIDAGSDHALHYAELSS